MSSDNASIYNDFHHRSNELFFSLEKAFRTATENVNREKEEFRFQQLKKDYANELKHELEMYGQELMKKTGLHAATGHELNDFIKEYLHRFVQKIDAF